MDPDRIRMGERLKNVSILGVGGVCYLVGFFLTPLGKVVSRIAMCWPDLAAGRLTSILGQVSTEIYPFIKDMFARQVAP